jgi:predicted HTH domain antitoxin
MQLTLTVPDHIFSTQDPDALARRIKLSAALWLFRSGEISAGAACDLADIDRFGLAAECARHGISLVDYSAGELEAELESLRQDRGRRRPPGA